jgi:hypothetical protein
VAATLAAQPAIFPLKDVRPGMKGIGKTVFSGNRVEEFQVEVLGVLSNVGPKQSIILARLSGGPLAETGVLQGMSGSPIYIDGRLAGALALAFSFSKEPIAGIRPIDDMLHAAPLAAPKARAALWNGQLTSLLPPREDVLAPGGARMIDIATPVSFSGFTRATIEHFAPQLRALGLEPQQGMAGGGRPAGGMGDPNALQPGSMISVQLLSGDMSVGADGTVTAIDGKQIYAFGHRFLGAGATDLPFARAEVLTLLPSLSSSFKISDAREWMGSITTDRSTTIAGELGRPSATVPVEITVRRQSPSGTVPIASYQLQMVVSSVLSPFLMQMALFSTIDATERALGDSSFALRGQAEFEDGIAPLKIDNIYTGNFNLPAQVSLGAATPLSYILQAGFENVRLKRIVLNIISFPEKRDLQIEQLWSSKSEVRPGEDLDLTVVLSGDNGLELRRKVTYHVPIGALAGPLNFTAADASVINLTDFRQMLGTQPKSAQQLLTFLNSLRANTAAYLRVWRAEPSYDVQGESLPGPPPSLALILSHAQASLSSTPALANSKVAEFTLPAGEMVVSGQKTIQVEVKQ